MKAMALGRTFPHIGITGPTMTKLGHSIVGLFALLLLPAPGCAASPTGQSGLPGELKAREEELEACLE